MKRLTFALALLLALGASARERVCIDKDWTFAFGDSSDPQKDFGCGTEYFTYLAKANSIHNEGPYAPKFVEDTAVWQRIDLPHDFAVRLPFDSTASYSHGFKTVGWQWPETSVGWYRKTFRLDPSERGQHVRLQLDGVFRDAKVWVNGIIVGQEPSGYIHHDYDITPYLLYGDQDNLICVRADASVEEGWFYEGAGIYRHVWLEKSAPVHAATDGVFVHSAFNPDYSQAVVTVETEVVNDTDQPVKACTLRHKLIDADGREVAEATVAAPAMLPRQTVNTVATLDVASPRLWDVDDPYLYQVVTVIEPQGTAADTCTTRVGLREVRFDPDRGLLLNGRRVPLRGFNMHQDHAGVGAAIPDGLQRYRMERLKWMGGNAVRTSHNPATKEMLDACDELGILVFEENRLLGVNPFEMRVAESMIRRDSNHPCVILWGIGNEEWGLEWDDRSIDIGRQMSSMYHLLDPTRLVAAATSSGPKIVIGTDVAGYNYIVQNRVDQHRADYPRRIALGSEETSGCGTRGVYFDDPASGRMPALNRKPDVERDSMLNRIERGLNFYADRDWLAGLFFWTGFDYRGEPNPMQYPATGSQFGLLDYCGFPKDEAYYLKACWQPETPMVHLLPHWNLDGHEGETVSVWAYSNCDEVELKVNGRSLGRKAMPRNGHLEWEAVYRPGYIEAIGYRDGKRVARERVETTGEAETVRTSTYSHAGTTVVDITMHDKRGHFVPTACVPITVKVDGNTRILGWGNGDSAYTDSEQPEGDARTGRLHTFNGCAQVILETPDDDYTYTIDID